MRMNLPNRTFFYILLLFAAYIGYLLMSPYLGTVVFAFVTVTVFRPIYDRLLVWVRGRKGVATAASIVTIFIAVLIPVGIIINVTVQQAFEFSHDVSSLVVNAAQNGYAVQALNQINSIMAGIPFAQGYQLTDAKIIQAAQSVAQSIGTFLADAAISLGSASTEWIINVVLYITLLSTMFPGYPMMIQLLRKMSPLSEELDEKYISRITLMMKSMVKGVFIIAVAQGLALGLFLWVGGVAYTSFWTILAIFMSILPLGCGLIGVPIGIIQIALGNVWQGIVILVGYVLVVTNIDYLLRPRLVSKETQINRALVLLSVFGGLKLFGFLGVIYGPVIMVFLVTTVEIYLEYYRVAKSVPIEEG